MTLNLCLPYSTLSTGSQRSVEQHPVSLGATDLIAIPGNTPLVRQTYTAADALQHLQYNKVHNSMWVKGTCKIYSKSLTCARADEFHSSLPAPQFSVGQRPHARHRNAHLLQAAPNTVSTEKPGTGSKEAASIASVLLTPHFLLFTTTCPVMPMLALDLTASIY